MGEIASIVPILFIAGTLEVAVFSRLQILYGTADLLMIVLIVWSLNVNTKYSLVMALLAGFMMSFYSALPMYGYFKLQVKLLQNLQVLLLMF